MTGWLRRPKDEVAPLVPRAEIESLLPASTRQPEVNRFTPLGSDMPDTVDDDDEDLGFLAAIAEEVDAQVAAPAPAATPAATKRSQDVGRYVARADDDLGVFRVMKDDAGESDAYDFKLADVDMADLLEDLQTVGAALKQRKAA